MRNYNRALDRVVLAMDQLKKGEHVVAAKLFASALKEKDFDRAIATIEASNKQAFETEKAAKLEASKKPAKEVKAKSEGGKRLKADADDFAEDEMMAGVDDDAEDADVDPDPLDEIVEDEVEEDIEAPEEAMAKVLSRMVAKQRR